MTWLLILFCCEVLLFLVAFVFSGLDIMTPAVMMCVMFCISTVFALMNVDSWDIEYSPNACLLLVSGIFIFLLGEIFFRFTFCSLDERKLRRRDRPHILSSFAIRKWKFAVLIALCIFIILWYFKIIKNAVGSASSIAVYFVLYRKQGIAAMAGEGEAISLGLIKPFLQILSALGYVSAFLLANALVAKDGRKRKDCIKYLILMVLSLSPSIMAGGRTGLLRLGSAFVIQYYILWHQRYGWNKNLSWKYMRLGVLGFVSMIFIFYYSLGLLGRGTNKKILDYASVYIGSSIELFNQYVQNPVPCNSFGEESLFSVKKIMHFLHIGNLSTSYNLEFRKLGFGHSNVYTFFRRPLHDFGVIGMYAFTVLVSFLFSWIYYKHIKYTVREKSLFWVFLYGYLYYWIICSSIVQYSIAYISTGTVITMIFIMVIFKFMTENLGKYGKIFAFKCIS